MYQQGHIFSTVSSFKAALLPSGPFFALKAITVVFNPSFDQFNHLTSREGRFPKETLVLLLLHIRLLKQWTPTN